MRNFLDEFIDFITGGFFNHLGATVRILFSKRKYSELVQEKLSNYMGMFIMTIFLLILYVWYKLSI
jgi:hypothetical protein